jgi:PAS domain S-box-containing protein
MIATTPLPSDRSMGRQSVRKAGGYFSRLEGRLVGLFLMLSLIPLVLVSAISIHNGTEALEQHIEARLEVHAQHLIDSMEGFLAAGHSSLEAWAGLSVMADMVGDDPDGRISRMLKALEQENSSLGQLLAVNHSGKVVAASDLTLIGTTIASEFWFSVASQRIASSRSSEGLDLQPVDGGYRITIPLKGEIKGLPQLGYLSAYLTKERLASVIRSVQVTRDSAVDVFLVGGAQELIVAGQVPDRFPEGLIGLGELDSLTSKAKLEGARPSGGALIAQPSGESVLIGFAHSRRFPSLGWRVITAQHSASALQPVQALRLQVLALGTIISILVVVLAMVVARWLSHPILAITQQAEHVAAGELTLRDLPLGRRDEIGSLAAAFQIMTDKLRSFTEDLEQQVLRRTAELEQSTARLRESEERFRILVEQVQDYAIILLDAGGRVLTWNDGAQRLKGYRSEDILHQSITRFYTEEDRTAGRAERLIETARTVGRVTDEGWRVRKDGSRFWADVVLTALHDDHGRLRGFAKVTRDITERKTAEEALQANERALTRHAQELQHRNRELEQFTYVASHDLAEPLRMVSNFCGLLKRRYQGRLDADADEFIGYAVDGAARMQALLHDLLALSRVDSKRKPIQATDCEALMAKTLANLSLLIEQQDAVVTHDWLPTVLADETQLGQVFQNLISNAVKFHGEKPPRVHITAVHQGAEHLFTVSDEGIGFDPAQASRIFVIFQRLHTKSEYPGTGIGLAICKKIVERHGGRIWAESTPGAGSRFCFTIPDQPDSEDLHHAQSAA